MTHHFLILFIALLLDRVLGDPDWLWRRFPHPVTALGGAIGTVERIFNRKADQAAIRRRNGWLAIVALVLASLLIGTGLDRCFRLLGPAGAIVEVLVVAVFLAQKSLADHVAKVSIALRTGGLAEGRRAVSMIVGRDPQALDEPAICRAAIESLAENFADGVVAPAFWYAVLGLPGLIAYKTINTADSMIGHRNERYIDFGRGSALLDDWVNWPAARLSALFIALASALSRGRRSGRRSIEAALGDAGLHRSPNAGWPEAAMAGGLDIALGGPRAYGGVAVHEPMLNAAGRKTLQPGDIADAIGLFWWACMVVASLAAACWLLWIAL